LPTIAAGEDLTIIGNGSVIERSTASGTPAFRLFAVEAGAALSLENMTVQGGLAYGAGPAASGGAIWSDGSLALTDVVVQQNKALGQDGRDATIGGPLIDLPTNGHSGLGGGLFISGGAALLTNVTLTANTAQGGQGGDGATISGSGRGREKHPADKIESAHGGAGFGGGLYAAGGTITLRNTNVTNNRAVGGAAGKGPGGTAGPGIGGGMYIEADALAVLDALTISKLKRNKATTSDPDIHGPYTLIS
jgi:hypothetical protein